MAVSFHSEDCDFRPRDRRKLISWIKSTISDEHRVLGDISYVFCSSDYHIDINRRFLNHDYNTDVITFDYGDPDSGLVSGDIMIDPFTVASNAAIFNTHPDEELMRVMIHGVLHLCGYGDKSDSEAALMRSLENKYLSVYIERFGKYPASGF